MKKISRTRNAVICAFSLLPKLSMIIKLTRFGNAIFHPHHFLVLTHQLRHSNLLFVNNKLDAQFFFMYVYFYSLHVSGSHVPIIRRINCINTTLVDLFESYGDARSSERQNLFLVCLFLFSTCFGQPRAYHQEN